MADNTIIFDIVVGKNQLTKELLNTNKQLEMAGTIAAQTGKELDIRFKGVGGKVSQVKRRMKELGITTETAMNRGRLAANRFDARLLSLLFGGMALKRAFGGILRGIFNTFKKAEDETSGLTQATTRLSAAWEFFKFSIMDALNTPFFINFIDWLVKGIRWFSQLGSTAKIAILTISGGLFLVGTALMIIGQVKLGWNAILGVGGFISQIAIMLGPIGLAAVATAFIALTLLVVTFIAKTDEMKEIGSALWDNLKPSFKNIKNSLNEIAEALGFEDAFDLITDAGLVAFGFISSMILTTALAVEGLIESFLILGKMIKGVFTLDWKSLKEIPGDIADLNVDIFKRVTDGNEDIWSAVSAGINTPQVDPAKIEYPDFTKAMPEDVLKAIDDYGMNTNTLANNITNNLNPAVETQTGLFSGLNEQISLASDEISNNWINAQQAEEAATRSNNEALKEHVELKRSIDDLNSWVKDKEEYESTA